MNIDELKIKLEELEVPSDKIDEVIAMAESDQLKTKDDIGDGGISISNKILELQNKLDGETDWRKRASLSARILSLKLGE